MKSILIFFLALGVVTIDAIHQNQTQAQSGIYSQPPKVAIKKATSKKRYKRVTYISETAWRKSKAKPVSYAVKRALKNRDRIPTNLDQKFHDID